MVSKKKNSILGQFPKRFSATNNGNNSNNGRRANATSIYNYHSVLVSLTFKVNNQFQHTISQKADFVIFLWLEGCCINFILFLLLYNL